MRKGRSDFLHGVSGAAGADGAMVKVYVHYHYSSKIVRGAERKAQNSTEKQRLNWTSADPLWFYGGIEQPWRLAGAYFAFPTAAFRYSRYAQIYCLGGDPLAWVARLARWLFPHPPVRAIHASHGISCRDSAKGPASGLQVACEWLASACNCSEARPH